MKSDSSTPLEWAVASDAIVWDQTALGDLASYCKSQRTTGLLVMANRRTVLERNWPVAGGSDLFERRYLHGTARDGALREDVASQQKSLVALLAAIAVEDGRLDLEQPVSNYVGRGWSKADAAQEQSIVVRHLLEMCSGLNDALCFEAPAGTCHYYNTPAYALMLPVLEAAEGQSIGALTQTRLTGPLGMVDTAWCQRSNELASFLGNPRGLVTTPRDLARLGQLVLDSGVAENGARLVSSAGLSAIFRRTDLHPAYGRLWWLNGGTHWIVPNRGQGEGSLVPTAPADALFALGSENRVLMVVPSRALILVRLGQQAPDADLREKMASGLARAMLRTAIE
ncbi:MAG TPA: serine hydrolase [Rubrivivax sp.]|nr:serine hydrolase [Rubrivivax sp.]